MQINCLWTRRKDETRGGKKVTWNACDGDVVIVKLHLCAIYLSIHLGTRIEKLKAGKENIELKQRIRRTSDEERSTNVCSMSND